MRIVAGHSPAQPNHLDNSQIIVKGLLEFFAAHSRIALLHLAQQALLGGQQNPLPIRIDRAAFEHQPLHGAVCQFNRRLPLGQAEQFSHTSWNLIVELPVGILGPRVESPVCDAHLAFGVADPAFPNKDRPRVARPHPIGRPPVKAHLVQLRPGTLQNSACAHFCFPGIYQNMYPLLLREQPHNLRIYPWNCLKLARPVLRIVRPCEPGGLVLLPLGGHAVAQFSRRCSGRKSRGRNKTSHDYLGSPSCDHVFTGSRKRLVMGA